MIHHARTKALIQRAGDCLSRNSRDEAIQLLAEASRIDPYDPEPPLLEAKIHLEDGRLERAAAGALKAIRIRPFHPAAMNLLAVTCVDAGYRAEAKRILSRLERDVPGMKQAKDNLKRLRRLKEEIHPIADFPHDELRIDPLQSGVSVCIAVADGDPDVAQTIESIRAVADQIVLVDATSGGPLELDPDGMTIVDVTPTPDRAALLNNALCRAERGWVFVLKPGETLARSSIGKLTQALEHGRTLFHEVRLVDTAGQACLAARLFRNAPGLAFSGSVLPSIRPALRVLADGWRLGSARPGVTLRRPEPTAGPAYGRGEIAACIRELDEDPGNPALALQLARVGSHVGDAGQALHALRSIDTKFIDREERVALESRCLLRLGKAGEALDRIRAYHKAHRPTRNTLYLLGAAAGANGDSSEAARALSRCAEQEPGETTFPPLRELQTAALPTLLGAALMDLGRYDEAASAFEDALRIEPENLEARMGLLSLGLIRGELESVLRQLDAWVERQGDDPRVWSYGSVLLGRLPELAMVQAQWTAEACQRFPDDPELRRQRIEAQMVSGQIDQALESLRDSSLDRPTDLAARWAASLVLGVDPPNVPAEARERTEAGVLTWLKLWMSRQQFETLDRALVRIPAFGERLPGLPARTASWLEQIGQQEAAERVLQRVGS